MPLTIRMTTQSGGARMPTLTFHLPIDDPQDPGKPREPPPPQPADEPPPVPEGDPPSDAPPERAKRPARETPLAAARR